MAVVALAFGVEYGITPIVHSGGIAKARPTISKLTSRAIGLNPPVVGRWERSYRTRGLTSPAAGSFSGVRARGLRGRATAFSEPSVGECG
jgi:hypothetical protein